MIPWRVLIPLCALVTIGQMASVIYLPSMPFIVHSLATNSALVGTTLTLYMFCFGLSQLFGGALSDAFGRKPLIGFGAILFLISSMLSALAPNIAVLLTARAFEGLGAGCITAVSRAMVNDTHKGASLVRGLSYTAIAASMTSMLSPLIGGFIQHHMNWRINFWFLAGYCLIVGGIAFTSLSESIKPEVSLRQLLPTLGKNYKQLLTSPFYLGNMLCATLAFAEVSAYYVASPFLFQTRLHLGPTTYSLLFLLTSGGFISGTLINNRLTAAPRKILLVFGLLNLASIVWLLIPGLLGSITVLNLLLPMILMLFTIGILYPRGMATAAAPFKPIAGATAALIGFSQMGLSSLAVLIMAHLPKINQLPLAYLLIGIALLSFLAHLLIFNKRPPNLT